MKRIEAYRLSKEAQLIGRKGTSIPGWGTEQHKLGTSYILLSENGIGTGQPSVIIKKDMYDITVTPEGEFEPISFHSQLLQLPLKDDTIVEINLLPGSKPGPNHVASIVVK